MEASTKEPYAAKQDEVPTKTLSVPSEASHEGFSSRAAFLFAAIGCAVGFGNVWRFPYLCYKHGGLTFIVAYFIVLIVIITPSVALEMGLGQISRGGNVQAWSKLGKYLRAPGMVGFVAFNVCAYYQILLMWSLVYFVNSFKSPLPWASSDENIKSCQLPTTQDDCDALLYCKWQVQRNTCVPDPLKPAEFFFRHTAYAYQQFEDGDHLLGVLGMSGWNVLGFFVSWTSNILSLVAGAKVLGYISYVTMTLPTVFIVVLVVVGATMEGSGEGIRQYIGKWDFEGFGLQSWLDSISQGVFSVGAAQGTFAAFCAHNKRGQNFVADGIIVIVADTVYAFLAGFAVFAVLGYLAHYTGEAISELPLSGITLAFLSYPVGLTQIPGVGANIASVLFFATLWLIGMSSLTGLTEAVILMAVNSRFGVRIGMKRWHMTIGLCTWWFLFPGLLMATNLGVSLLQSMDNFSTLLHGFGCGLQCSVAGWLYLCQYTSAKVGKIPYIIHGATFHLGPILMGVITTAAPTAAGISIGVILGVLLPIGGFLAAVYMTNKTDENGAELTIWDRIYYLTVYNLEPLRKLFNDDACVGSFFRLPLLWSYMVKYVVPYVILFLTAYGVTSPGRMFGLPLIDSPFPWYIFLIGIVGPLTVIICLFIFLVYPDGIIPLLPPDLDKLDKALGEELVPLFDRKNPQTAVDTEKGSAQ